MESVNWHRLLKNYGCGAVKKLFIYTWANNFTGNFHKEVGNGEKSLYPKIWSLLHIFETTRNELAINRNVVSCITTQLLFRDQNYVYRYVLITRDKDYVLM